MKRALGRVVVGLLMVSGTGGCDSAPSMPDAGTDAFSPGVVLTVDAAAAQDAVGGVTPGEGFQYYVLDVSFEARGVGPISVAPNALTLTLEGGGAPVIANNRTGEIEDGCRSQMVPVDGALTCRALFIVPDDAPPPATLSWADASHSATASVPPLSTE